LGRRESLRKYIDASIRARAKFLPSNGAGASYIELYLRGGPLPHQRKQRDHRRQRPWRAMAPLRAALIEYWLGLIRSQGTHPSAGIPLVVGEQNQRLCWLMFVSLDPLGHKLWDDVQNLTGQR
jgi:hypothetical protein